MIPSVQYLKGKVIFHREGNTHNEIKKLDQSQRQGSEQSYRETERDLTEEYSPLKNSPDPRDHGGKEYQECLTHCFSKPNSISLLSYT